MKNIDRKEDMIQIIGSILKNVIIDDMTNKPIKEEPIGIIQLNCGRLGLLVKANFYDPAEIHLNKEDGFAHVCGTIGGALICYDNSNIIERFNNDTILEEARIKQVLYLKDFHKGQFKDPDEFDKFFMNPDSTLLL